jgi:molecular chaperone IbpA
MPQLGSGNRAPDAVSVALRIHVAQTEDVAMRTFDPTPFWRSTVGFDHLFDLLEHTSRGTGEDSYPPYNIARTSENGYQICLALAGFTPEEINITAEENLLTVEGSKTQQPQDNYLYRGISTRPFRRMFNLAEFVQVTNASFENGLLKIELVREVPEAMKPRRIAISGSNDPKTAQLKAA